jgi:protein arginine kinase activator
VKCERCNNEATCHDISTDRGKVRERHLCEACAQAEGITPATPHIPITQLLDSFLTAQAQSGPATPTPASSSAPSGVCPGCGTTLNQFRQTGLLGCPDCYTSFEAQLSPLLQRAHEGGTQHRGKQPARMRAPGSAEKPVATAARGEPAATEPSSPAEPHADRIEAIKARLAEAIAAERYEEAARLRDELLSLAAKGPEGDGHKGPEGAGS